MTDRQRLYRWLKDNYAFMPHTSKKLVTYMLRREKRAEYKGYKDGFHAGFETGQYQTPANDDGCTCERGADLDHWSRCEVHGKLRGK